ncbi:MAG TPA: hypothetical protein VL946_06515 [Lacibacter sp.]|nr:hypothetical protein [Lacibacter sp.]
MFVIATWMYYVANALYDLFGYCSLVYVCAAVFSGILADYWYEFTYEY